MTTTTIAEALAAKHAATANEERAAKAPTTLKLVIDGEPVADRNVSLNADGSVIRTVTADEVRAYEGSVRSAAHVAVIESGWAWSKHDVFTVLLRISTSRRKKHPYADDVFRGCADACSGVLWGDKRDVLDVAIVLRRGADVPRVEMEVRRRRRVAA